jgi:hypothetical protein
VQYSCPFCRQTCCIGKVNMLAMVMGSHEAVTAPPPPQAARSPPSVSTSDGGGGGSAPRCPICLEDLAPLGVVTLPCTHTVCVGCTSTLVNLSPTFQSQQEHNRDHDLAVPRVPRALQPA